MIEKREARSEKRGLAERSQRVPSLHASRFSLLVRFQSSHTNTL